MAGCVGRCWPVVVGVALVPLLVGVLINVSPPLSDGTVTSGPGWNMDGGGIGGDFYSQLSGPTAFCDGWSYASGKAFPYAVQFPSTTTSTGDTLVLDVLQISQSQVADVVILRAYLRCAEAGVVVGGQDGGGCCGFRTDRSGSRLPPCGELEPAAFTHTATIACNITHFMVVAPTSGPSGCAVCANEPEGASEVHHFDLWPHGRERALPPTVPTG